MASAVSEARGGRVAGLIMRNALANAGGVIAFLPLLSLLLPIKVESIAGDARLDLLTAIAIAGSLAASLSNLLFGWLSDWALERGHGRRSLLGAGLALTALSYAGITLAATPGAVLCAVLFFQFSVNAMLAPLYAIMADEVPDRHKRMAGGLLSMGAPFGATVSAILVATSMGEGGRMSVLALVVALCVTPLLTSRAHRAEEAGDALRQPAASSRRDLLFAWGSRLMVQTAGAVMSLYLIYYFETILPGAPRQQIARDVGTVIAVCYFLPLPIAVLVGRWSDRIGRGKPFLCGSALIAALGIFGMAMAGDWVVGVLAFATYSVGWTVFLGLHSGFTMQLLPDPRRRGRDLGLVNLTNTLPQLLGPLLTWLLATPHDFDPALLTLAGCSVCGALLILGVRGRR